MRSYGRWSGLKSTKKYNSDSALRSHIIVEHWILWAGKMTRQYYCQTPQMYLLQAHYYIASKHITASSLPTQAQRTVHCGIGQTATSVTCSYCDSEKETPEDLHTSCLAWTEACEHLFGRPTEITSCTAVQHCVNGDHDFLWEMAKFDPSQNQNPFTGWYEIVNIWLRPGDMPPNQIL